MRARCNNPKHEYYALYGGRGIRVCDRWSDFVNFIADMGDRPGKGWSLDRYPDPNGNYEPGNVRWATIHDQQRNKRTNRILTFQGETMCEKDWATRLGIDHQTISARLINGWSDGMLADGR